jgi:hypothetical protein
MRRAVLIGVVVTLIGSGYSGWLIYRADVAGKRLQNSHAGVVGYRPDPFEQHMIGIVPRRWLSAWRAFRARSVLFQPDDGKPVAAAAFDEVRHLPFVEVVHLQNCVFNPHDLARLTTARQLAELDLDGHGRRISDDALDAILQLRGLRVLRLTQSCLSDDGVARLAALEHLTLLDLRYCHCVSQTAVDRLAAKLPNCRIDYNPPVVYHRYTCPKCGYATNLSEQNGLMGSCWRCGGSGPMLVQKNFDVCHPVIEHRVPRR